MNRSVAQKLELKKEAEKRKREEVEKEEEEASDFDSQSDSEEEDDHEEEEEVKEPVKEVKKAKKSSATAKKDDDTESQTKKPRVQREPYLEKNVAKILNFVSDRVNAIVDDNQDILFDSIDDLSKKEKHTRLVLCKTLCSRVINTIDPLIKQYETTVTDDDKEVFKQTRNTFVNICNQLKNTEMVQRQLKKV